MKKLQSKLLLVFVLLLSLTPIIWFLGKSGDILINGVDTNFPLDPVNWFLRRFYVWDAVANAGRDFSSSTAGLFFHFIQVVPYFLGASLQLTQIISFVFWFALIVFGSFVFARLIFPDRFLIQLLFVVLYSFNIYLFNTWENVKVANLALIAAIPLALSILMLLQEEKIGKIKAFFYSVLIGIIISGAGINPSYFICFFVIIFIFSATLLLSNLKSENILKVFRNFALVVTSLFLVNLFWILPTTNFVVSNIGPQGSIDKIGFNNWVDSLSEHTSIFNVMRVQGAWDWYAFDGVTGTPLYIPYALNYFYRLPFLIFGILLPALVILSLSFRVRKNYLYPVFGLMFILGVFLGVGTHLPTGDYFRWLANHLPFFTLFRSPWYIFTSLVTLSTAGLISLLFYNLENKIRIHFVKLKLLLPIFVLILMVANLFYSYPLISGKIFRPSRPDGFFIEFPKYVLEAGRWLDKHSGKGRIVGYPDDEIEQFDWKYRGIESILELIGNSEVLFAPLNNPDFPVPMLVKDLYKSFKKGEQGKAIALAEKLNISTLFEKSDQKSLAPSLDNKFKLNELVKFGNWNFYQFPDEPPGKIYSPTSLFFGSIGKEGGVVLSVIDKNAAMINKEDTIVQSIRQIDKTSGDIILAENQQMEDFSNQIYKQSQLSNRLTVRDLNIAEFNFDVKKPDYYEPALERYKLEYFGIDLKKDISSTLNGIPFNLKVKNITDSYVYFDPIRLEADHYSLVFDLKNKSIVRGGDFENGGLFTEDGNGSFTLEQDKQGYFLTILNKSSRDISANFVVDNFDSALPYLIQFRYKQTYGNNASVLVGQNTDITLVKTQVERLPNYPEWQNFSFYYQPVFTPSIMKVLLVAPETKDPLGTKVQYADLNVFKVFSNNLVFIGQAEKLSPPTKINFTQKSPVEYRGEVTGSSGPHFMVFSENYSPLWELSLFDNQGKRINQKTRHFSINLYANGWYIEGAPADYKFEIYYKPQRLFLFGIVIALIMVSVSGLLFIYKTLAGKNR